jgi:hypothetical protein
VLLVVVVVSRITYKSHYEEANAEKAVGKHGVSNTYCRAIESVYRAKERAV